MGRLLAKLVDKPPEMRMSCVILSHTEINGKSSSLDWQVDVFRMCRLEYTHQSRAVYLVAPPPINSDIDL